MMFSSNRGFRGTRSRAVRGKVYFFDLIEDYPVIGGVVEYTTRLKSDLRRRLGDRFVSVREATSGPGWPDASAAYVDRERICAQRIAAIDPDSTFLVPNFQSPLLRRAGQRGPRVINVVHDVQFVHHPEYFSRQTLDDLYRFFGETRTNADHVVFVSGTSRDQYIDRFGAPVAHSVVHPPILPSLAPMGDAKRENFLLAVAHHDHHPHKNFAGLLRFFAELAARDPALRLVLTGRGRESFAQYLAPLDAEIAARIDHRGYVAREELDGLYASAKAFVTLSRFEGFDMPAAEAALAGTPLILSDIPVHRELFGHRALLVATDAPDVDQAAQFLASPPRQPGRLPFACDPATVGRAFARIVAEFDRETRRTAPAVLPVGARVVGRRLTQALLASTVMTGIAALTVASIATAAEGPGGALAGAPGIGGMFDGGQGADGANGNSYFSSGGGGGSGGGPGFAGGAGGADSFGNAGGVGGTAGTTPGADGGNGGFAGAGNSYYYGAGGGGGGGGGAAGNGNVGSATIANGNGVTLQGGAGGQGASGRALSYFGTGGSGGGGAGGAGALITGTGLSSNSGTLNGGTGGNGADGNSVFSGGASGAGGGGGDGGIGLRSNAAANFTNTATGVIKGGDAGQGGIGNSTTAPNGNGGRGGDGVYAPAGMTLTNAGTITGGAGGNGGQFFDTGSGYYGTGGAGGAGVRMNAPGTLTNNGSITGGVAGGSPDGSATATRSGAGVDMTGGTIANLTVGGTPATISGGAGSFNAGPAGFGITGSNLNIVTNGTIQGGLPGGLIGAAVGDPGGGTYSSPNAAAVVFTGGTNSLTLQAGYVNTGLVVVQTENGATGTLGLGGATNFSFDVTQIDNGAKTQQYQGFSQFQKVDTSTATLTGTTTAVTPWSVLGGVLSISTDGALGATAGAVTLRNGGVLQTTATITTGRNFTIGGVSGGNTGGIDTAANTIFTINGTVGGPGLLNKTGTGTLALGPTNTWTGGSTVFAGTLQLSGATSAGTGDITMFSDTTLKFINSGYTIKNNIIFAGLEDPIFDSGPAPNVVGIGGLISGADSLTKIGTGTLVLTAANTYTGNTNVTAGTLQVDGSIASSILTTLSSGAAISGIGSVGALTALSGSSVAPGNPTNPYGTFTAFGAVSLQAGSTFFANVDPSGASSKFVINANANFNGNITVAAAGGTYGPAYKSAIVVVNGGTLTWNGAYSITGAGAAGLSVVKEGDTLFVEGSGAPPTPTPTGPTPQQILDALSNLQSVQRLADDRVAMMITNRVLANMLLGYNEQINCSDCVTGFGSVGSFSAGFHGRKEITRDLSIVGGAGFAEYRAGGVRVTAPIIAGVFRYDWTELGSSRPFAEIGGVVSPGQRVTSTRNYGFAGALGQGKSTTTVTGGTVFGRLGWVSRFTPQDEAAVAVELGRGWQRFGGASESGLPSNPYPLADRGGIDRMNTVRVGGQWTHLFIPNIEGQINLGFAHSFGAKSGLQSTFFSTPLPVSIGDHTWGEYGARLGYRFQQGFVVDVFADGTVGPRPVGNTIHGGVAARYSF